MEKNKKNAWELVAPEKHITFQKIYEQNTSTCLQNLELFALARVLALPNDSRIEFEIDIFCELDWLKKLIKWFPVTVLPAPVTPVTNIDCDFFKNFEFSSAFLAKNLIKIINSILKII